MRYKIYDHLNTMIVEAYTPEEAVNKVADKFTTNPDFLTVMPMSEPEGYYFIGIRTRTENKLEKSYDLAKAKDQIKALALARDVLDVTVYDSDGNQIDYVRGIFAGYKN